MRIRKLIMGAAIITAGLMTVPMSVNATEVSREAAENVNDDSTQIVSSEGGKYQIMMSVKPEEDKWYEDTAKIIIGAASYDDDSEVKIKRAEVKIGEDPQWNNVSDDLSFDLDGNSEVTVRVVDEKGVVYEMTRHIKCFDSVMPTINAAVSDGLITILCNDTESGVDKVFVNDYEFAPDAKGVVNIRLQKFDVTYPEFQIYAVDKAGNKSTVNKIANPYYREPDSNSDEENPVTDLPTDAVPDVINPSVGTITGVTDEDGKDISKDVKVKQFYSFITADGQQYFLVIDMSGVYRDDDGVDATHGNGSVYLLTSVSNENLLHFTNVYETTLPQNSVAQSNAIDKGNVTPDKVYIDPEEERAAEELAKKNNIRTLIIAGVIGIVFAVVIVLTKRKGKKNEKTDESMYGGYDDSDADSY